MRALIQRVGRDSPEFPYGCLCMCGSVLLHVVVFLCFTVDLIRLYFINHITGLHLLIVVVEVVTTTCSGSADPNVSPTQHVMIYTISLCGSC